LGGKIPRNIKEKVIRQWLHGLTRENIAKENDIGAGTVTGIIQEAKKQEEYQDIDLLRQVSLKLKEEGLELPLVGFAIRVKRIVEENDINEDQIESIIQDIAAYCLRHSIPFDTVIKSGREALYLEEKYDIPVEKIPELIIQAKERIDRLEHQTQEILRKKQQAQEECDAIRQEHDIIVAELEKYGKEIPLIKRIKELEMELDEEKKLNEHYETRIIGLEKELNNARLEAAKFEGDGIEIYAMVTMPC
jgi:chromosome segregation ATPase